MSHGHDHDPDAWFKKVEHLAGPRATLPTYPGNKPFLFKAENVEPGTGRIKVETLEGPILRPKLGMPNVREHWYHDWGIWAWFTFFALIVVFIFTQPYRFGQLLGGIICFDWISDIISFIAMIF